MTWITKIMVASGTMGLYFASRFILFPHLAVPGPEECHTGGIATDLLNHGYRFSFVEYTPEYYENGIVGTGFLAVLSFGMLGANLLAIKLIPFLVSVATLFIGLGLVSLSLRDTRRSVSAWPSLLAYALLMMFGPSFFIFESVNALGGHNDAAFLNTLLLFLLLRRAGNSSSVAHGAFWIIAGLAFFWHKGVLQAIAIAALFDALNGRPRSLLLSAVFFTAGYAPGFWVGGQTSGLDLLEVYHKFRPGTAPAAFAVMIYDSLDRNPWLLAMLLTGLLAMGCDAIRDIRRHGLAAAVGKTPFVISAASFLNVGAVLLTGPHGPTQYFQYFFPTAFAAVAVSLPALAHGLAAHRGSTAKAVVWLVLALWIALAANRTARWDPAYPIRLLRDRDRAACSWRFGRAFLNHNGPKESLELCRTFEDHASLECISGLAFGKHFTPHRLTPTEFEAYLFGLGRRQVHAAGPLCAGPENRQACWDGAILECAIYGVLTADLRGEPIPPIDCPFDSPLDGFFKRSAQELSGRLTGPSPVAATWAVLGIPRCTRILAHCAKSAGGP